MLNNPGYFIQRWTFDAKQILSAFTMSKSFLICLAIGLLLESSYFPQPYQKVTLKLFTI